MDVLWIAYGLKILMQKRLFSSIFLRECREKDDDDIFALPEIELWAPSSFEGTLGDLAVRVVAETLVLFQDANAV